MSKKTAYNTHGSIYHLKRQPLTPGQASGPLAWPVALEVAVPDWAAGWP